MGKYTGVTVQFNGWMKYNGRNDVKKCTWLRLENTVSFSEAMHGLDADERYVFIEMMCVLSSKQEKLKPIDKLKINESHIASRAGAKESRVESAITKLIENSTLTIVKTISTDLTDSYGSDGSGPYPTYQTDLTNQTDLTDTPENFVPDFDSIYRRYPRKEGKSSGLKKLKKEIHTEEDFEKLIVAVENYSSSRRNEDPKFTKHFSTFISEWRDWIVWEAPVHVASAQGSMNYAQKRQRANAEAEQAYLDLLGGKNEQAS